MKDSKYRYRFFAIEYLLTSVWMSAEKVNEFANKRIAKGKQPTKQHQQYIKQTDDFFNKLSALLKEAMAKQSDDW